RAKSSRWRWWRCWAMSRLLLCAAGQTRRGYFKNHSPLPPWESAAAAAHSKIAGLQRGTGLTAPASWSAARERRFAWGCGPQSTKIYNRQSAIVLAPLPASGGKRERLGEPAPELGAGDLVGP